MDNIRDRVMGDQPDSFLHKIASIVPGYEGYVDRERRRDADKLLRTHLARQYSEQRDRLNRVQQALARARQFADIAEVDRLVGILQRFIDRLSTATYGYAGLFDPIKVEAADLDQLYAFDMALSGGVDQVSSAIEAVETASQPGPGGAGDLPELPAALSRLSALLDELNQRLNQRADLLTSGTRLDDTDYRAMVTGMNEMPATYDQHAQNVVRTGPGAEPPSPQGAVTAGEMARYPGGIAGMATGNEATGAGGTEGTPTTNLSTRATTPAEPGMSSLTEGNQGFSEMPSGESMAGGPLGAQELGTAGMARGEGVVGSAGSGIETASSPATSPGAPGHDLTDGLSAANNMGTPDIAGSQTDTSPAANPNPMGGQEEIR
jgi:hypothetical protein